MTFDKVYLNGAVAHAFFADKQVAEKPADTDITYSASWILLKDSDGFSQAVTMLDAPTRVKISKTDITTHEEIPGATLRVLDTDGKIMDEWVSADTPHYMEAVLIAGKTYTLEETLVPNGSGYPAAFPVRLPEQGAANEIHGAGAAPPVQTIPVHVSFPYTHLLIYRHGQAASVGEPEPPSRDLPPPTLPHFSSARQSDGACRDYQAQDAAHSRMPVFPLAGEYR